MFIKVNGKPEEVPDSIRVFELLERLGLAGAPCAVEVNRTLVPKRDHAKRKLVDGDQVEIVTLVGGG